MGAGRQSGRRETSSSVSPRIVQDRGHRHVDHLVDCLVDHRVERLVDYLVDHRVERLVDYLVDHRVERLVDHLVDHLVAS